jgi:hypothetical protein
VSRPLLRDTQRIKRSPAQSSEQGEASGKVVKKLDGTLSAVVKEILRLHGEILSAARMSLDKAIRIGGLLYRVRASRKGCWLEWLLNNVQFSRATAYNYMRCFDRREFLTVRNIHDIGEAYKLMYPSKALGAAKPKRRSKAVDELVSKGIARDERAARKLLKEKEEAPVIVLVEKPKPEPRADKTPKGCTPDVLNECDLTADELAVVKQLREHLAGTPALRAKAFMCFVCGKMGGDA